MKLDLKGLDRVKIAGLLLIAAVWVWAWITARDEFWAGRSAFITAFILLGVAIYEVMQNGVEKS